VGTRGHPDYKTDQNKVLGYALAGIGSARGEAATDAELVRQAHIVDKKLP
jgi:hypothetical protein